jgi:hypothetical protein
VVRASHGYFQWKMLSVVVDKENKREGFQFCLAPSAKRRDLIVKELAKLHRKKPPLVGLGWNVMPG